MDLKKQHRPLPKQQQIDHSGEKRKVSDLPVQEPSRSERNIVPDAPQEDSQFHRQPPVNPGEFATDADVKNSMSDVLKPDDLKGN